VGVKDRKLYERLQQDRLNVPACESCGRWGDTPGLDRQEGTPVACELVEPSRIYQYEIALDAPSWTIVAHRIHLMFNPDEPCGVDCSPPRSRNLSGLGGLDKWQRIKMAVKIESIAGQLTDLYGGTTMTGACPFHDGSGRELVIWTDIEEWKCYGRCQTGGDVIHFIKECDKRGLKWV
jgi:hypothetical protein